MTPIVGDYNDGSVLYMPQTYNQEIGGGSGGEGGVQTEIALDQVNSLVANTDAYCIHNADSSSAYDYASNTGGAQAGDISQGDLATGAMTASTSTAATVDAFTQSIVLGANLQNNSFTMQITGHDSTVDAHHA